MIERTKPPAQTEVNTTRPINLSKAEMSPLERLEPSVSVQDLLAIASATCAVVGLTQRQTEICEVLSSNSWETQHETLTKIAEELGSTTIRHQDLPRAARICVSLVHLHSGIVLDGFSQPINKQQAFSFLYCALEAEKEILTEKCGKQLKIVHEDIARYLKGGVFLPEHFHKSVIEALRLIHDFGHVEPSSTAMLESARLLREPSAPGVDREPLTRKALEKLIEVIAYDDLT